MGRISMCSGEEDVWFGNLKVLSLVFAGDAVLLTPSDYDLQCAPEQFTAEWEAVGMGVSSFKSVAWFSTGIRWSAPSGLVVSL